MADALDELYREPPERFTELRNQLARKLKDDGDAERAAEVKSLRKPSNAAHVVNRLGLRHAKDVKKLVDSGDRLRSAYESGDGARLRKAAAAERQAVARLVSLAEGEAEKAGIATTPALMDRVTETLQAVSGDEETRRLVQDGRLDRERKVATLGFPTDVTPKRPAKRKAKEEPKRKKPSAELESARKELRRVTRELAKARANITGLEAEERRLEKRIKSLE
jgi:hypothetical protein